VLVTASVVPSSPILVSLMKEALSSSETSVLHYVILRGRDAYILTYALVQLYSKPFLLQLLYHWEREVSMFTAPYHEQLRISTF
jgi:hypothetical protein